LVEKDEDDDEDDDVGRRGVCVQSRDSPCFYTFSAFEAAIFDPVRG
jgi:hypothetical protein